MSPLVIIFLTVFIELLGFGIIIPVMEFTAIASYIGFRIVSRRET